MPEPTVKLNYKGRPLEITVDPMLAVEVYSRRSVAAGARQVHTLGLLAMAIGWPGDRPWVVGEKTLLDAAAGRKAMFESAIKGKHYTELSPAEQRGLKQDLANATDDWRTALAAVDAADVLDLPLDPEAATEAANRVRAALLADGIPIMVIAQWAVGAVGVCEKIAVAGFVAWTKLEAQGFSIPPEEKVSSGGSPSPAVSAETPPAGLD